MRKKVAIVLALTLFALIAFLAIGFFLFTRLRNPAFPANVNIGNVNVNIVPSPTPSITDWKAAIQSEEDRLRDGKIVFNPPAEMQEQKTETMQARISFEDIGVDLSKGLRGPGPIQEAPLKVSEVMKVTLTGDGNAFLIQSIVDDEQIVAGKEYAEWEWHVTPLRAGDQKLVLTATAIIFLQGRGEKPILHKTLEKPIMVRVDRWYTSKQFIANNWQWLWAVVVVPVAGLLWKLRKRKNKSD